MTLSPADQVFHYHEQTKHSFHRSAKSMGYMDWASQPNPYRSYSEVETISLPLQEVDSSASHLDLYERPRNRSCKFNLEQIAVFMELSLGLSAWKSFGGNRWSLRVNPSSGNLHPTEGYLLLPSMDSIRGGVFHYQPYLHALERRADIFEGTWKRLVEHFQCGGFFVALTSIPWRESWKYGERAFRYCNHDIGHALAALSFSANLLGWKVTYLKRVGDDDIDTLLGFRKADREPGEEEYPELVCMIHESEHTVKEQDLSQELLDEFRQTSYFGRRNKLSSDHADWKIISDVAAATVKRKPAGGEAECLRTIPYVSKTESPFGAAQIIRRRRSLLACDGKTFITTNQFLEMMDKTLPRESCAPFDIGLGQTHIHLFLFVHRVTGLAPGLYCVVRNENHLEELQANSRKDFAWRPVEAGFPLYCLLEGEFQHEATRVSCDQNIAGDGAFSLGMVARFRAPIETDTHMYRRIFWESGMIGQVLYLEAEAHGVRGTGIGCFFDDPVHKIIGLHGNDFQSIYHFTVGVPVEDSRLETDPPYSHLERQS
jgi:SagB-type dehydrogenase family enzyme